MVRVGIEDIALSFPDEADKRRFMARYEKAIAPFTKARGIDWEVQVSDWDRSLWHMNGMALKSAVRHCAGKVMETGG
ncbi:hypothetical protein C8R47DRAFT_564740 [Mycena vitilis]|nr:hypothetical protein C8R47DRAFT_564740 [Mycena vitilis]